MKLTKKQCEKFIEALVEDKSISEDAWENHYQHLRDDLSFLKGNCNLDNLHEFHLNYHGIHVKALARKYGVIK